MSHYVAGDRAATTEWNLADSQTREDAVLDVIGYIESQIISYFSFVRKERGAFHVIS